MATTKSALLGMNRDDLLAQLAIEKKRAAGRMAILRREMKERQTEVDALESRLRMIEESEGYLNL